MRGEEEERWEFASLPAWDPVRSSFTCRVEHSTRTVTRRARKSVVTDTILRYALAFYVAVPFRALGLKSGALHHGPMTRSGH